MGANSFSKISASGVAPTLNVTIVPTLPKIAALISSVICSTY